MSFHPSIASTRRTLALSSLFIVAVGCGESAQHRRVDSIADAKAMETQSLATTLAEQKDSLVTVVLDAEKFLGQIDSSISRVKGLPKRERGKSAEGVLQQQLEARKDMLFKVDALVKRAQATASQLAAAKRRESGLKDDNAALRDSLDRHGKIIAELGATIQRQVAQITELQGTVQELSLANQKLGEELKVSLAENARVYYVIGREDDLVKKGIIVREGGMNLLMAHPGRTVHPSRTLDSALFQQIDAREVSKIVVPDPAKRYTIVSRHSLDDADVSDRKDASFKGDLRIPDAKKFWATSRYLILVQG